MNFLILVTAFLMNGGALFAQAAGSSSAVPQDLGGWLAIVNIGLAGVGLLAFVKGWIVAGYIHEQSLKREAASKEENALLRKIIEDQVIPELVNSRETQKRMIMLTERFVTALDAVTRSVPTKE